MTLSKCIFLDLLQSTALLPSKDEDRAHCASCKEASGLGWAAFSLESAVWCAQQGEAYRWAVCKDPLPLAEMRHVGIPLPAKHVDVLHSSLAWEDLQVRTFAQPCTGCIHPRPSF